MHLKTLAIISAIIALPGIAAAAKDKEQEPPKKEKRVCREGTPTGSRLNLRTCHTAAEWVEIDRQAQEHADREVERVQTIARGDGSGFNPN